MHALWRDKLLHGTQVAHTNPKPCVEAKFEQVTLSGEVQDVLRTEINPRSLVTCYVMVIFRKHTPVKLCVHNVLTVKIWYFTLVGNPEMKK
jgi:hypothetical protein